MNIAYILPSLANKGPVLVVRDLVREMKNRGHRCSVFYFDDKIEVAIDCPCRIVKFQKMDFSKYDIVHSHGLRPDLYVFLFKPRKSHTKFITTLHNYVYRDLWYQYNPAFSLIFGTLWAIALTRHDRVVALSDDAKRYYSRILFWKKLDFAYNTRSLPEDVSLTQEEQRVILDFKGNDCLIGVNALLTFRKGVDIVIRALPALPGYKLFIVGDGKEKGHLEKIAEDLNVRDRVYFAGYVKDAYRFIKYYDVYAMPSRSEGFGLSLIEAVIYKKPVVLSSIPIFRELFSSEEVSFFELSSIESFVEAVENVKKCAEKVDLAYNRFISAYSPEIFYKRYISIYER